MKLKTNTVMKVKFIIKRVAFIMAALAGCVLFLGAINNKPDIIQNAIWVIVPCFFTYLILKD